LGSSFQVPDLALKDHMEKLFKVFQFYNGPIQSIQQVFEKMNFNFLEISRSSRIFEIYGKSMWGIKNSCIALQFKSKLCF
jgi:hypothetical protein